MKAFSYGPNKNLFGVFTEASPKTGNKGIVAIAWNTGICGRMGPSRLNVEIAAMLSEQGIASFRFDLGNLGDSGIASQETDLIKRNREELQITLDMLSEKFAYTKFLLVGICSSAVDAHHVAVADPRIVGLIMVDSYVYPTKQFHINYLKKRLFKPTSWKRFTSRKIKEWTSDKEENPPEDLFEGVYPDQEEAGRELQSLVDRNIPIFVLYTGGFEHVYTYHDQFLDMFPKTNFKGLLTLKHHPRADHLFTILEDRDLLMQDLREWSQRSFNSSDTAMEVDIRVRSLIDVIKHIDEQNPTDIAIEEWGKSHTYADLKTLSHGLAHQLKAHGIAKGSILGLCLDRSAALIVSLSATLRSGSAYLPLDPHYPKDRLEKMIELAQCQTILCHRRHSAMFAHLSVKLLIWEDMTIDRTAPAFAAEQIGEHDPAYVIFTSGSTGTPKGVVLGHGALTQLLDWHALRYPLAKPRTLQFTPVSFDVSFQEIFTTLMSGGTLVLIEEELRLDPIALIDIMESSRIQRLFLPFVALQFIAEASDMLGRPVACLEEVFTAGEALKTTAALRRFFIANQARLHNHYGPSETHVITAYELPVDPREWTDLPPIGEAIDASFVLLLDPETMEQVPEGSEGELFLGGKSLAEGYIHRPDLTAERFIPHPRLPNERLYKTGDIGRIDADGQLLFLGRKDGQIKIRGHRIELGEIEVQLGNFPGVGQILVDARTSKDQIYLVAYLRDAIDIDLLKAFAAEKMPEAMRPSYYLKIADFPRTPSGKIDRKALPSPFADTGTLTPKPTAPAAEIQVKSEERSEAADLRAELRALWTEILPSADFADDQNFFDAGGTSLLAMRFVTMMKQRLDRELRIRDFFSKPTLNGVYRHFNPQSSEEKSSLPKNLDAASSPIAIIGMAVDIPGLHDLDSFFDMLLDGRSNLTRFTREELDASLPIEIRQDPNYVPVRGVMDHPEDFDNEFFSIPKREAELIDPQQRRLLQLCWSALEDAGMSNKTAGTQSGVFLGTGYNTYLLKQLMQNPQLLERAGDFQVMLANDKDYVATRVAYKLDLKGPALAIHSACSTSLVATVAAVQSLRRGECDLALAGAMSIQFPSKLGHIYQDGDIMSRDGNCKPFDSDASGTMFCDGGAVITLKRLDDAVRDGDRIYSVIRGAAWNNDGREKASFSAPGLAGQMEVIRAAIADSSVEASSISYVEAHGTATPIGDPLEWEALRQAYAAEGVVTADHCLVGSIKGNIGHTTHSAGVLGLIKTSLALYYEKLPGTAHFKTLNPEITAGPFYVQSAVKAWPRSDVKRRAGISSFGVGGTNAHLVIEEAPLLPSIKDEAEYHLLALSNQKELGLEETYQKALKALSGNKHSLSSLANAYGTGRKHFAERQALLVNAKSEVIASIRGQKRKLNMIWVFPGQGSQLWGMGRDLHRSDADFRMVWDDLVHKILDLTGTDLKTIYWDSEKGPITNTKAAQLGLFAIGYSLGKSLMNRGIKPEAMMGHSVGEWVAASLAGIWTLDDVIRILGLRGSLMEKLPEGGMLSVRASLETALAFKPHDIDLAAANGAMQQVFSGPVASIERFADDLQKENIASRRLESKHAFHSWMVEEICETLRRELETVAFSKMTIPLISTVHGLLLTESEARDPNYWSQHARVPVRFQAAVQTASAMGDILLLEMGPRLVATNLARKELSPASLAIGAIGDERELEQFLKLMAQLWVVGAIEAEALQTSFTSERAPGVSYVFQKSKAFVTAMNKTPISIKGEPDMRVNQIREDIRALVEESSGELIEAKDDASDFAELGLDSLFLTQLSLQLRNRFKVDISFRQLSEELSSVQSIAGFIDTKLPPEQAHAPAAPAASAAPQPQAQAQAQTQTNVPQAMQVQSAAQHFLPQPIAMPLTQQAPAGSLNAILSQQLSVIQQQLALLGGQSLSFAPVAAPEAVSAVMPIPSPAAAPIANQHAPKAVEVKDPSEDDPSKKVFGAMAKISKVNDKLGPLQRQSLDAFQKAYNEKTKSSKHQTQAARSFMADPRVVTGFKPVIKEMIYPILVNKSKGSELWDIDGNHYVDMLNGFGSNFFGYSPDFITKALKDQIDTGYELGPQHPLAIEASALATELTGWDRVAWCNTGSEAVLGAMRIARTVTGRTRIASFTGSYHGINDEVIIRGTKQLRPLAAAPGIMTAAVQNMLVLDYGTDEALKILREQCKDLAAILVEPVQSRRPEFRPIEFLKELRKITEEHGTLLIFDEVITGFRYHPGGFAASVGIQPDLGTYGKVVGGGMPIGMIGGKRQFIDALDGGHWNFGDSSIPEVGVTYFAGTFVRHPLALAAAVATMQKLKADGPALQESVNKKADRYCAELNAIFKKHDAPYFYANFGSLMKLKINDDAKGYPELLATWLRNKGVHIWDSFPTFITCAHTDEQIDWVIRQFEDSIREMQMGGLLGEVSQAQTAQYYTDFGMKVAPSHPQAKLGVDESGQAAWFIPDPDRPGKFKQLMVD